MSTLDPLDTEKYKIKLERLMWAVDRIKPGMTRHQVERILPTLQGGIHQGSSTTYREQPGFLIVVPFDLAGGPGAPINQVNGSVGIKVRQVQNPGTLETIVTWQTIS